jgi:uncharacterized protein
VWRNHDFRHNRLTWRSRVHIPHGPSGTRWPVVVLIHGFTGNRMEHASFVRMSLVLEGSGTASVRVDLSGHGESDGDFFDVTITGEIAEARRLCGRSGASTSPTLTGSGCSG